MTIKTATKTQTSSPPSSSDSTTSSTAVSTTNTNTSALPAIQDKVNWSVAFPIKLHRMLVEIEKKGKSDIISWLPPDGKFFKVHNTQRFEDEIMPIYFGSTKYRSFQKNLNMWGFTTIRSGCSSYRGSCFHPLFMKESVQMCYRMQRRDYNHSSKNCNKNKKTEAKEGHILSHSTGNGSSSLSSSRSPPQQQKNKKFTAKRHHDTTMEDCECYYTKYTTSTNQCGTAAAHIHEARLNQEKKEMFSVPFSVHPKEEDALNVDPSIAAATVTVKYCNTQEENRKKSLREARGRTTIKNGQKKQEQQHRHTNITFHEGSKVVPDFAVPLLQTNVTLSPLSRNMNPLPLQKRRKTESRDTLFGRTTEGRNSNIGKYHFQMTEYDQQQRKLLLAQMALKANYDSMLSLAVTTKTTYNGDIYTFLVQSSSPGNISNRYIPSKCTLLSPSIYPLLFQQNLIRFDSNNLLKMDESFFKG